MTAIQDLRTRMTEVGATNETLAKRAGVSVSTVKNALKGSSIRDNLASCVNEALDTWR